MPAHKPIPEHLLAAARRGELKRSNTAPGTPERQAADRIMYLRRLQKHPEESARKALGHRKPSGKISTLLDGPPEYILLENATRMEMRRAGRYDYWLRQMLNGEMGPNKEAGEKAFERKIKSWKPIRGRRFLADPREIFKIIDERIAAGLPLFEYEKGE